MEVPQCKMIAVFQVNYMTGGQFSYSAVTMNLDNCTLHTWRSPIIRKSQRPLGNFANVADCLRRFILAQKCVLISSDFFKFDVSGRRINTVRLLKCF